MSAVMSRRRLIVALVCSVAFLAIGDTATLDPAALSAGSFTTPEAGPNAFDLPVAMLDKEQMTAFALGKEQFHEQWVVAPENGVWGLGPTFNEDRCSHCHENNGRAKATQNGKTAERGVLVRLSIPGTDKNGGPLPHPVYGEQLQNRGVQDRVPEEGQALITYEAKEVAFADGEKLTLRVPKVQFTQLQFGDMGKDTLYSVRTAQAMVGMGLLEAVPEKTILALAKSQEPYGMAGKPNYVWDVEIELTVLGRFGWKANQPNIRQQTAAAFFGDVGATTYLFPEENCPPLQKACLELPSASKCGGQGGCTGNQFRPEVVPSRLSNITLYLQTLAVPARRNVNDPAVKQGEALFAQAQCSVCHVPELQTDAKPAIRAAANLAIHPYTDLLLHDMGEELADGRPDFKASGREWRTAPLWGLGLLRTVNGHSDLLHDGRARNVTEAVLWHGGQAEKSREAFKRFSKAQREALVKFVESL
ncbi:MAG: di-heme oxidoredictase family protein [Burkholderiales bacterium]